MNTILRKGFLRSGGTRLFDGFYLCYLKFQLIQTISKTTIIIDRALDKDGTLQYFLRNPCIHKSSD